MLEKLIEERNLAPFLPRDEMLDILQREEYGYLPPKPESITFELVGEDKKILCFKSCFSKIICTLHN